MSRKASSLSCSLISHFNHLEKTRIKVTRLFDEKLLVKRDLRQVYKGLFLDAYTSFETFIEELFIGLVSGKLKCTNVKLNQINVMSTKAAKRIVFGEHKYLEWLPYKKTVKRSSLYFVQGNPFSSLADTDKGFLTKMSIIRNALAHKSNYSISKFDENIILEQNLTPDERTPEGYICTAFRSNPSTTRYEIYTNRFSVIAKKLTM